MYRPQVPVEELSGRQLISNLAANQVVFGNLIEYGNLRLAQEEDVLNQMSLQALLDSDARDRALLQYGKVSMLRELISYANQFIKH